MGIVTHRLVNVGGFAEPQREFLEFHRTNVFLRREVRVYLSSHGEIVNRIGREITGITSENSMKNVFYRLRDRNLIEPVPGRVGFGSAWRKKAKSN